jgi:tRNA threonylcarbamoyl adenosine modification protein YeaZ
VGVATAKALGQALGLGVVGVSSLDVLAFGARNAVPGSKAMVVVPVVDARRGEVFAAAYRFADGRPGTVDPAEVREDRPHALAPAELAAWLGELADEAGQVLIVGDGAVRYRDVVSTDPRCRLDPADDLSAPQPRDLAGLAALRLAAGAMPTPAGDLVPDYRRHADARINWEQRAPQSRPT